jgi:hypothetical protein
MSEDLSLQGTAIVFNQIIIVGDAFEQGVEIPITFLTRDSESCELSGAASCRRVSY